MATYHTIRDMARAGAAARIAKQTPERRREIARAAANKRWAHLQAERAAFLAMLANPGQVVKDAVESDQSDTGQNPS